MADARIQSIITPSLRTIKDTFTEINVATHTVKADIESILDTLKVINDTLEIFTGSTSMGTQLRGITPLALMPATLKLATEVVSKYVTKRTGISFVDWAKFVNSILAQFGEYTRQLDKVAELSEKYNHLYAENTAIDKEEANHDEATLVNIRLTTQAWKGYIEKITKLIVVMDAILDAQKETIKRTTDTNKLDMDLNSDLRKMLSVVTDKIDASSQRRAKELLLYFFSSVYDLKSKTKGFGKQARELLPKLSDMENLLDLGIAQVQVYSGRMSQEEAEILEARVAATITVPQLRNKLVGLRQDVSKYEMILEKLNLECSNKGISEDMYKILLPEYKDKLNSLLGLLHQTEEEAAIWKTNGISYLDAGVQWIRKELEIVKVRKLVGQLSIEELQKRSKFLNQELRRLHEAKETVTSL